jgi:hypothetical protein
LTYSYAQLAKQYFLAYPHNTYLTKGEYRHAPPVIERLDHESPALLSIGALLLLPLTQISAIAQTSATTTDLSALFVEARATAAQLNRDAVMMESSLNDTERYNYVT